MARTLTIHRESRFVGCAVACGITLDGRAAGSVRSGDTTSLAIDENAHELRFTINATTKPGFASIPAGSADVTCTVAVKIGLPYARIEAKVNGSPARIATVRNELDDYRPGGSRYIPAVKGYEDSQSVEELEEFIIARVAALMFDKYLDIENNPLAETARKNGSTLRALDLRFQFTEGVLKGTVTGYSSRERSKGSQLFSLPNDLTFDWLLSNSGCDRTSECATHDLVRMRDLTLSHIAERRPDAFLSGDVLRSA